MRISRNQRTITPLSAKDVIVPACKHFFKCLDTDGVMRDSIGGVSWSSNGSLSITYNSSDQTLSNNLVNASDPVAISGAWHTFSATEKVLFVWAGEVVTIADVRMALGDINGLVGGDTGLGMPANNSPHVAIGTNGANVNRAVQSGVMLTGWDGGTGYSDGVVINHVAGTNGTGVVFDTATVTGGVIDRPLIVHAGYDFILGSDATKNGSISTTPVGTATANVIAGLDAGLSDYHVGKPLVNVMAYTPGTLADYKGYDINNGTEYFRCTTETGGSGSLSVGEFTPDPYFRWSGVKLYGAACFAFSDSIPSDYLIASRWMAAEWKRGNRVLWPLWSGLT